MKSNPPVPIVLLPPACREVRECPTDAEYAGRRLQAVFESVGVGAALLDHPAPLNEDVPLAVLALVEQGGGDEAVQWIRKNLKRCAQLWIFGHPPMSLAREIGIEVEDFETPEAGLKLKKIPRPAHRDLVTAEGVTIPFETHAAGEIRRFGKSSEVICHWAAPRSAQAVVRSGKITFFAFSTQPHHVEQWSKEEFDRMMAGLLKQLGFAARRRTARLRVPKPPAAEMRAVYAFTHSSPKTVEWRAQSLAAAGINTAFLYAAGLTDDYVLARNGDPKAWQAAMRLLRANAKVYRKHGIEVHAWSTPCHAHDASHLLRGRLVCDAAGNEFPWLDLSYSENRSLVIDVYRELANAVPWDGIHFDYFRFPSRKYSFSPGARSGFSEWRAGKPAGWPQDVIPGGALRKEFENYRTWVVNETMQGVSSMLRREQPGLILSAVPWPSWPESKRLFGQDAAHWATNGCIDFVCAFNFTQRIGALHTEISQQVRALKGHVPYASGIGILSYVSDLYDRGKVLEQVQLIRKSGGFGFALMHHGLDSWMRREAAFFRELCGGKPVAPPWRHSGWPGKFLPRALPQAPSRKDWIVPDYMRYSRLFAD